MDQVKMTALEVVISPGVQEQQQQQQQQWEQKKKCVRFSPAVRQKIIISVNDSEGDTSVSSDSLWYNVERLMKEARADVKSITRNLQNGTMTETEVYSGEKGPCGRGLEAYIKAGKLSSRQRNRKAYSDALLRKQETLLTLSSNKDEVADRLEKFLSVKSKACRQLAQTLGVQDSVDALAIYENVDLSEVFGKDATSPSLTSTSQILSKQKLITSMMRSHHSHPSFLAAKELRAS